jgi:hypothetical protein
MSDNEDSTTLLGHSEVLSVQNSVGDPIPEFAQRPEDGTHCAAVIFHAASSAASAIDVVRLDCVGDGIPGALTISVVEFAGEVSGALADR